MSTSPESRKRPRPPPSPPFVDDYRPYSAGQLRRLTQEPRKDHHRQQWDLYYRNNTVNGYRDRHYILREFVELREAIEEAEQRKNAPKEDVPKDSVATVARSSPPPSGRDGTTASASTISSLTFSWMEAGCGVGNAMLPIFEAYGHLPQWRSLLGFDISSVAIRLLEEKISALPAELARKVHVCAFNPCEADLVDCTLFCAAGDAPRTGPDDAHQVEFVSMVFVMCSIPVSMHLQVLRRIGACMQSPGGVFFFRDYCVDDHAETRFRERDESKAGITAATSGNTYMRANGTLSHFFSLDEVRDLFVRAGFAVIDLHVVGREVENRKTEALLSRRFIQGRFRFLGEKTE